MNPSSTQKKPWLWVASLYFSQGVPYATITLLAMILYKGLMLPNAEIALYTSLFVIPWFIKPLWAPALEAVQNDRKLTLIVQCILAVSMLLIALSLATQWPFAISLPLFFIAAFAGAIYDTVSDSLYLKMLEAKQQLLLVGARTVFYQLGRLVVQGGFVVLAAFMMQWLGFTHGWQSIFVMLSALLALLTVLHMIILPQMSHKTQTPKLYAKQPMRAALSTYFQLPQIGWLIFFLTIYNFPETQLTRINPLFLLDAQTKGGLGLTVSTTGFILGFLGIGAMAFGSLVSGWIIHAWSLHKALPRLSFISVITNLGYLILCHDHTVSLLVIYTLIVIAQFGYGLSNGAYMAYSLHSVKDSAFAMSHYALHMSFMALGSLSSGAISGYLQEWLGYQSFFYWILVSGGLIAAFTSLLMRKNNQLRA